MKVSDLLRYNETIEEVGHTQRNTRTPEIRFSMKILSEIVHSFLEEQVNGKFLRVVSEAVDLAVDMGYLFGML